MTDTPETDANDQAWAYNMQYDTFSSLMDNPLPWDEFARKLERERDAAIAERDEAREQRDELAKALDVTLNATVLNHRNDRWHIDAEHLLYRIRLLMQPTNQND